VCFFFIGISYGRGGGVGRGLGVSAGLGVGEGLGVKVDVAVGVAVEGGVDVGVTVGVCVAVAVAVAVGVAVGVAVAVAVAVGVGVGEADCAQYLPPVLEMSLGWSASCGRAVGVETASPPQTIISLPVHAAVCAHRAVGASLVVVAVQLSVLGLYRPPVSKRKNGSNPPQMIISLAVQTAV
jgi:hypothetical protein